MTAYAVVRNAVDRFLRPASLSLAGRARFEVLHDDGLIKLRHYLPLAETSIEVAGLDAVPVRGERHRVPILIVPPLAGNMLIYDLFPNRSLVKYLVARGFDVYLIDWGEPSLRHTHFTLETYVCDFLPRQIERVRAHAGTRALTLHGWSLGGLMVTTYAAWSGDEDVRNLVVLGAPIDSHASGGLGSLYRTLSTVASTLRPFVPLRIQQLDPRLFYTPGWANVLAFKMTNPMGSLAGYWELLARLADRDFVVEHATNSAFLDNMVAYPGGVVQDMIVRFWIDNDLADGSMRFGERTARLDRVHASVLAIAGETDNMVTAEAASRLLPLVATDDKEFVVVPGGHMGMLSGSAAPVSAWTKTADWLEARSD